MSVAATDQSTITVVSALCAHQVHDELNAIVHVTGALLRVRVGGCARPLIILDLASGRWRCRFTMRIRRSVAINPCGHGGAGLVRRWMVDDDVTGGGEREHHPQTMLSWTRSMNF